MLLRRHLLSVAIASGSLGACGPDSEAKDALEKPKSPPPEASAPFDRKAAHAAAFVDAREQLLELGRKVSEAYPPLSAEERVTLQQSLERAQKKAEGVDPSFLDPKSRSEFAAYQLLAARARALLASQGPESVDPHAPARQLRRSLRCAEAGLSQQGRIDSSCAKGWTRAARAVGSLRASSEPALESAREELGEQCRRLATLAKHESWSAWAEPQVSLCESVGEQLQAFQLPAGKDAEPKWLSRDWAKLGDGPLLRLENFPTATELTQWFALATGWRGSQQNPAKRAQRALMALQMRARRGPGAPPKPFSTSACEATRAKLELASPKSDAEAAVIDCARLEVAALGLTFSSGEQDAWALRRARLDPSTTDFDDADGLLARLRSPTTPTLRHLQMDLLEKAGLDEAAQFTRSVLIADLCRATVVAEALAGNDPKAPASCPRTSPDEAAADPIGALEDLELAFADFSAPVSKDQLNGIWLPLGWRIQQSIAEPAAPPSEERPVRLELELPQQLTFERREP